ncbi:MAG: Hpt domain-containing protein, partial [Candidatus Competibacteraceae bacterium]|nr:Hpt domain-containing protein [Candidatus Competibacteraceae bacterium]
AATDPAMAAGDTDHAIAPDHLLELGILQQLENDTSVEFVVDMINIFIPETQQRLANMQKFATQGDLQALDDEAHTLKSSAETFGLIPLKAQAVAIEQACKTKDTSQIEMLMQQMPSLLNASLQQLSMRYHGASQA